MNEEKKHSRYRTVIWNYFVFFLWSAFLITCCTLLFVSVLTESLSVKLDVNSLQIAAKLTFANVILLSILFTIVDSVRRRLTVEKPAKEIKKNLKRLMTGDFTARIDASKVMDRYNHFGEIAEYINALAVELSGIETLRSDFVANVSHELKTPLSVMQSYGTMLRQPGITEKERIEYASAIMDGSQRLSGLITNVLKLNMLENQQIYPSAHCYDLSEQLCRCLLQFEEIWDRKKIKIETEIEEGVTVFADAELLSLVWNNLFSNAFKFTQEGGQVTILLFADEEFVTVKVIDTGCGMSLQVGSHIFEKFYQGDVSHATQGNGLGLALVKRVMDILNGEIKVESELGKGSVFTVELRRLPDKNN